MRRRGPRHVPRETTRTCEKEFKKSLSITADSLDTGANWRVLVLSQAHNRSRLSDSVKNVKKKKKQSQHNSLAQHWAQEWAQDWRALALTQVHHWSRLSDSGEDGEALSSVHSTALAVGKLTFTICSAMAV